MTSFWNHPIPSMIWTSSSSLLLTKLWHNRSVMMSFFGSLIGDYKFGLFRPRRNTKNARNVQTVCAVFPFSETWTPPSWRCWSRCTRAGPRVHVASLACSHTSPTASSARWGSGAPSSPSSSPPWCARLVRTQPEPLRFQENQTPNTTSTWFLH